MRSLLVVTCALLFSGCSEEPSPEEDAGDPLDSGMTIDAGLDAGSDAGRMIDAGPSPVRTQMNAVTAFANCRPPTDEDPFFFAIVIQYDNDDPANDYTIEVQSALVRLDQAPMTELDVTFDVISSTVGAGGMILLRHGEVSTEPMLADACTVCADPDRTVTYDVTILIGGMWPATFAGTTPFTCMR